VSSSPIHVQFAEGTFDDQILDHMEMEIQGLANGEPVYINNDNDIGKLTPKVLWVSFIKTASK
jgi:hypothetical protein